MAEPAYKRIVILTGAGISAESGLGTFRDEDGIWAKYDMEDVATPDAFARNPDFVHDFHNGLRQRLQESEPNAAHVALAALERDHPAKVLVVTQNVDDLHERAGTQNLIHMHGELLRVRCEGCGGIAHWTADLGTGDGCAACGMRGLMRPHVVWFYEMPLDMERINAALLSCDLFISIGTSGNVYPAAGFVADVRRIGTTHTVELNLEPSEGASSFAECRHGPASDVVPGYVGELLAASP